MVVDLAVDGEDDAVIGVGQGLGTALWLCVSSAALEKAVGAQRTDTHDAQTLMAQDCRKRSARLALLIILLFRIGHPYLCLCR